MAPIANLRPLPHLLTLGLVLAAVQPARADKWPGTDAPPGGAIAAKVIGQNCHVLAAGEVAELETYIARRRAEFVARGELLVADILSKLDAGYTEDYSKPQNCTAGAAELSQDMLQRVRKAGGSTP